MERALAIEIVTQLSKLDGPLNAAMLAVEKIPDVEQKRNFRRALAAVTGTIYTDLWVPIGAEFPDLLPDENDRRRT